MKVWHIYIIPLQLIALNNPDVCQDEKGRQINHVITAALLNPSGLAGDDPVPGFQSQSACPAILILERLVFL